MLTPATTSMFAFENIFMLGPGLIHQNLLFILVSFYTLKRSAITFGGGIPWA